MLCLSSLPSLAQNELSKYLQIGDRKMVEGDFIYALNFYHKAMDIDSNTVEILWKMAEANRAYKDYSKAVFYYQKVYDREEGRLFPYSLLYLGLMQKQAGKYDGAIDTFKKAKKKYAKSKGDYPYLKSKRELESCLWAREQEKNSPKQKLEKLGKAVNSQNAEFPHTVFENMFYFSSLRPDSLVGEEVFSKDYRTRVYQAQMQEGDFYGAKKILDLVIPGKDVGNMTFTENGSRSYFSICGSAESGRLRCKIGVARFDGKSWINIDTLGDIINAKGANTTMPFVTTWKGKEVLFFVSDRNATTKHDLFYSFVSNGNTYSKPQWIKELASLDDELSPYFDGEMERLYFSSSWWNGMGGQDVFYSDYRNGTFQAPVNIGLPVNSAANDQYYFVYRDTSYFSSNRIGSYHSVNPTCCSDIYRSYERKIEVKEVFKETFVELNKRLPLRLYFHNDCPDPRSTKTTTQLDYIKTYRDYILLSDTYKREYSQGLDKEKTMEAEEDIDDFFNEYVRSGFENLTQFTDLMLEELKKGYSIQVQVRGFASPLAKSDYNVHLTKRRISSLRNYWMSYGNGAIAPYMLADSSDRIRLSIIEIPFGAYTADKLISDNPNDKKNSIYSRAASLERKIEIESVTISKTDNLCDVEVKQQTIILDADRVEQGVVEVELTNNQEVELSFKDIVLPDFLELNADNPQVIGAKSQQKLAFILNEKNRSELSLIRIIFNNCDTAIEVFLLPKN